MPSVKPHGERVSIAVLHVRSERPMRRHASLARRWFPKCPFVLL